MDPIKEAFAKAKQDIAELRTEISEIKLLLSSITDSLNQQTNKQTISTQNNIFQQSKVELNEPYYSNEDDQIPYPNESSIGNRGVPTNKQTNQQTNKQTNYTEKVRPHEQNQLSEVIETFDNIKEQLKLKFKSLTKQEMSVFVAIYILEEQKKEVDYPTVANHLGLTETSIRDYVLKMTKKGIPLVKKKQNNKRILLSIDPALRKIAPLSSIFMLRDPTNNYKIG